MMENTAEVRVEQGAPASPDDPSHGNGGRRLRALDLIDSLIGKYRLEALSDFLESTRQFAAERAVNVAILGRFKAGKTTFLNDLLGRALLPVGVIPVTSIVTEIEYGRPERAEVEFAGGRREGIPVEALRDYVDESRNPGNRKGAGRVRVWLPEMERYRGIRFVDTPGMESVFEHNTEASRDWLPNVGLALVAVSVDPPLTQHDIALIAELERYTPRIALLLTKIDLLDAEGRRQVEEFVRQQLAARWDGGLPVYPYSAKPGFEDCRRKIEDELLGRLRKDGAAQWEEILQHKIESLGEETAEYLTVALKAAERADSDREQLRQRVLGEKAALDDTRLGLELIVRHATATSRASIESRLRPEADGIVKKLFREFEQQFPGWTASLQTAMDRFDAWLEGALRRELAAASSAHREEFLDPVRRVSRQLSQSLQDFRNRLSEKMLEALGVPLKTSQMEMRVAEPREPDIRVGRIFDRNWELLSWAIPMTVFSGVVRRHFRDKIGRAVEINLARLTSQWNDAAAGACGALLLEAKRRLDSLVHTVEQVLSTAQGQAEEIRQDLGRLEEALRGLTAE
ncbi:MAG: dynamin family protein [Acidobacteriota bacterium]